jgi:hypothetical protein
LRGGRPRDQRKGQQQAENRNNTSVCPWHGPNSFVSRESEGYATWATHPIHDLLRSFEPKVIAQFWPSS